eukprot:jgi/Undpi1/1992/HiC_scaffold_12.g05379.m1
MSSVHSYRIKRVQFFGRKVPILCQNENGPCPLLAVGNILLLQSNIFIHPDLSEISFSELTQLVAGFLLDSNPPHEDVRINVNQQTQLDTVIKLLPRLQYGLDVNVRFNSIRGFEFTEEMAAFDMSGVTLLHGWIVDPEDKHTVAVIEGLSYNKLVEKLLDFRSLTGGAKDSEQPSLGADDGDVPESSSSPPAEPAGIETKTDDVETKTAPESVESGEKVAIAEEGARDVTPSCGPSEGSPSMPVEGMDKDKASTKVASDLKEGQVAEEFFRETASQLTYFGLSRLHAEVRERQLCVFFRNNHFSTMFKYEGKLYLLITDLGYARESSVVWEKLDQIDGDTEYVDSNFTRSSRCTPSDGLASPLTGNQHDDQDYMLALALQQEDASALASASGPTPRAPSTSQTAPTGDEAVALALHQEERALLEQRTGADRAASTLPNENQGESLREGAARGTASDRRGLQDRDRRRPAEAGRRNRSESGPSCSIQ